MTPKHCHLRHLKSLNGRRVLLGLLNRGGCHAVRPGRSLASLCATSSCLRGKVSRIRHHPSPTLNQTAAQMCNFEAPPPPRGKETWATLKVPLLGSVLLFTHTWKTITQNSPRHLICPSGQACNWVQLVNREGQLSLQRAEEICIWWLPLALLINVGGGYKGPKCKLSRGLQMVKKITRVQTP